MKKRIDVLLFEKGLVKSRNEAIFLILDRKVKIGGKIVDKGTLVDENQDIEIERNEIQFVSRGGFKLLKGIENFGLNLTDKTCLDIGASTGGFTDCMLQHGAKKVYAIDVGYGQLDWKLRNDLRVVNIEKTNFRHWDGKEILQTDKIDFVSIDVSFISLKNILPNLFRILQNELEILALIKPQFEVGRKKIGKNGVVKNEKDRLEVIENLKNFISDLDEKIEIVGVCESPLKGPAGNVEYLIYLRRMSS